MVGLLTCSVCKFATYVRRRYTDDDRKTKKNKITICLHFIRRRQKKNKQKQTKRITPRIDWWLSTVHYLLKNSVWCIELKWKKKKKLPTILYYDQWTSKQITYKQLFMFNIMLLLKHPSGYPGAVDQLSLNT